MFLRIYGNVFANMRLSMQAGDLGAPRCSGATLAYLGLPSHGVSVAASGKIKQPSARRLRSTPGCEREESPARLTCLRPASDSKQTMWCSGEANLCESEASAEYFMELKHTRRVRSRRNIGDTTHKVHTAARRFTCQYVTLVCGSMAYSP